MYQFDKIKLVIWDLDDTLWNGTISEEAVVISDLNRGLVKRLTEIGIINSICSKNSPEPVIEKLQEEGLWEYFVFASVSWEPKGARVRQMIEEMQLRSENVLFVDDNPSNRSEAAFCCPGMMTEGPEILAGLFEEAMAAQTKDPQHKRLKQYRLLEAKQKEKTQFSTNEEFLYQSGICVEIGHDCKDQLERIHELILRANQLNFTKQRSTQQELQHLFEDGEASCGYISVYDHYGDYGLVGFYALKHGKLLHFVFSCRILGMGIEQYVYNQLGRPELTVSGQVVSDLSGKETPGWINQTGVSGRQKQMSIQNLKKNQVLIKGPCDLFQIYPYIARSELFDTEFTYTTASGLVVESTGHTTNVVESLRLSESEKQRVLDEVPFTHEGMYCDQIFRKGYRVAVISIITDANLGVYRRKETGERFAFLEFIHPLTDPKYWDDFIAGKYPTSGYRFTEEILREFAQKYEFVGRNSPEQIVENLNYIRENLPADCIMVVMLGGELYYEKNTFEAYRDRHLVHKKINAQIRRWAEAKNHVRLIDVNRYLKDQSSFYDHFNHYTKPVYYALASELVAIVNEATDSHVKQTTKLKMAYIWVKERLAPIYYKLRKMWKR